MMYACFRWVLDHEIEKYWNFWGFVTQFQNQQILESERNDEFLLSHSNNFPMNIQLKIEIEITFDSFWIGFSKRRINIALNGERHEAVDYWVYAKYFSHTEGKSVSPIHVILERLGAETLRILDKQGRRYMELLHVN